MSKSGPLTARKLELEQKERLLLSDMSEKGSKVKQIAIWSLVAGVIGLLGYGIYRSFSHPPKKKKKKKHKVQETVQHSESNQLIDNAITFGGPVIGRWLLNQLQRKDPQKG
jgi:hypothetical protein